MEKHSLKPVRQFLNNLAEAKLSLEVNTFEHIENACKEIIDIYRTALRPKPDDPIIMTGLMFDAQVYPDAYQIILDYDNKIFKG